MSVLREEEIKNAIVARLMEMAPNCEVYKEATTVPVFPHFFVHLLEMSDEEDRRGIHLLNYSFDLRYRVKSDPSTDLKLEQDLDAMALKVLAGLNVIPCGERKIRVEGKRYEKVDGVLHLFCSVTMMVVLPDDDSETVKQNKLDIGIHTRRK